MTPSVATSFRCYGGLNGYELCGGRGLNGYVLFDGGGLDGYVLFDGGGLNYELHSGSGLSGYGLHGVGGRWRSYRDGELNNYGLRGSALVLR